MIDAHNAVGLAEGFIEPDGETQEDREAQIIEAWQYLHDSRLAYQLQGFFGRTAQALIEQGIIVE